MSTCKYMYQGRWKHIMPGMDDPEERDGCHNGGDFHHNYIEDHLPCLSREPPTRELLEACIWNTSARCLPYMPSIDPAVRR